MNSNYDFAGLLLVRRRGACSGSLWIARRPSGVAQRVTEMDVNIYRGSANTSIANYDEIPFDRHIKVAYDYRDYFSAFKMLHCSSIRSCSTNWPARELWIRSIRITALGAALGLHWN
jgi:hypothetical protein